VIAGQSPSPRTFNNSIPDGVMGILRRALQRDPAKRYASAAEMGSACEHFLYDKGYGPTNLTLKQYLHKLFPDGLQPAELGAPSYFPVVQATLIPIDDPLPASRPKPAKDATPLATAPPEKRPKTAAAAATVAPETIAPDPKAGRGRPRTLPPRKRD